MANMYIIQKLPRRIANKYFILRNTISKIQKTAASIGFIKKSLHCNVTPTFAKITGNFINKSARKKSEAILLRSHLSEHYANLRRLAYTQTNITDELIRSSGKILTRLMECAAKESLRIANIEQLRTKNGKLNKLIDNFHKDTFTLSTVPTKNLSSYAIDTKCLNMGLQHSYTDKNKYVKQNIAVEFEHLAISVDKDIPPENKENFHEFLRGYTNKFSQNIYLDKDNTYKSLADIRNNKDFVVL